MPGPDESGTEPWTVTLFCSSSNSMAGGHYEDAMSVGAAIARRGWRLVYGGTKIGLMAAAADGALAAGGVVVGVLPRFMLDRGIAHDGLWALEIVECMRTRKARMEALADAFLVLPGGLGTLEETFEIMTLLQLGQSSAPIVVMDTRGFYEGLWRLLERLAAERAMSPGLLDLIVRAGTVEEAVEGLGRAGHSGPDGSWRG